MSKLKESLFRNALYNLNAYNGYFQAYGQENGLTLMYLNRYSALVTVIDESGLSSEWEQYKTDPKMSH